MNNVWSTGGDLLHRRLIKPRGETGKSQTLVARSSALKKLAQWESDAPFDYWSQTKQSSNPADMAEVVRIRGMWRSDNNKLTMERLNEDGFMYLTAKSCRNGEVRGHFYKVPGDFDIRFGVGLNYWVEGKYEAATRLGVDAYEVKDDQLLNNGIFAVYGTKEVNNAPGIKLYQVVGNVFQPLSNGAGTAPPGGRRLRLEHVLLAGNELQRRAHPGHAPERHDLDDRTSTMCRSYYGETMPWTADQTGRAAFYAKNVTSCSTCYPFSSTDTKLYLDDISNFPASETIIANEEQIYYSGKSTLQTAISSQTVAPYEPLTADLGPYTDRWVEIGRYDTALYARRKLDGLTFPAGGGYGTYVEAIIHRQGDPQFDLVVGLYKNDASASVPLGTPVETFTIPRSMIGTLGGTFGFFFSKVQALTANGFNVVISTNGPADANNYYYLYTYNNLAGTTNLASYYNKTTNTWVASGTTYEPEIFIYGPSFIWSGVEDKQLICVGYVNGFNIGSVVNDGFGNEYTILDKEDADGRTYMLLDKPFVQDSKPRTLSILPYLTLVQRGLNGTLAAAHARTTVSVYRPTPLFYCDKVEYFSSDIDLTLEDIVGEIARKTGVETTIADDELIPAPVAPNVGVTIPRGDVVIKCKLPSLNGTVVLEPWKLSQATSGIQFTISSSSITYGARETFLLANPLVGDVVVSFFEDSASFWCNGTFIHSFQLVSSDLLLARMSSYGEVVTQMYLKISGTETTPITVSHPRELDAHRQLHPRQWQEGRATGRQRDWREAFLLPGYRRWSRCISSATGRWSMKARLTGLTVSASDREEDAPGATWIRVEGGEIYEAFDEDKIAEYGMIFRLTHMNEVNNIYEAIQQADYVLEDFASQYKTRSLEGEADFRIEPNDLIYYETDQGVERVIVDSVDFEIAVEGDNARCSMSIEGRLPQ